MNSERPSKPNGVVEPAGKLLTIDDIRKAEVAASVRHGLISLEEACDHYKLSVDEILAWVRVLKVHGVPGLRATQPQNYPIPDTRRGRPPETLGVALDL